LLISVPSYIIPGTYLENLRFISSINGINSVELLFFVFTGESWLLFKEEEKQILEYKNRFSFTLHMPLVLKRSSEEIIITTKDYVRYYIIHPPKIDMSEKDLAEYLSLIEEWRTNYGNIFLLENLVESKFTDIADRIEDLPICFDTGHLLLRNEDPGEFIKKYNTRIKEIHLHGVKESKDHEVILPGEVWMENIKPFLEEFEGVLNIEVFSSEKVYKILDLIMA